MKIRVDTSHNGTVRSFVQRATAHITWENHMLQYIAIRLRAIPRSERGATAVEYGLLVAGIAAVIVAVVFTLGTKINTAFTTVNSRLT